jgi:hypothetical protein
MVFCPCFGRAYFLSRHVIAFVVTQAYDTATEPLTRLKLILVRLSDDAFTVA